MAGGVADWLYRDLSARTHPRIEWVEAGLPAKRYRLSSRAALRRLRHMTNLILLALIVGVGVGLVLMTGPDGAPMVRPNHAMVVGLIVGYKHQSILELLKAFDLRRWLIRAG